MNIKDRTLLFEQLDAREAALATPIDIEQLQHEELLTRVGDWYQLHSFALLPEAVKDRIIEIKLDELGLMVRLEGVCSRLD